MTIQENRPGQEGQHVQREITTEDILRGQELMEAYGIIDLSDSRKAKKIAKENAHYMGQGLPEIHPEPVMEKHESMDSDITNVSETSSVSPVTLQRDVEQVIIPRREAR